MSGKTFSAKVIDLNSAGEAVLRSPEGKVFFAEGLWLNEVAILEEIEQFSKKNVSKAKLLEMIAPHPLRRKPQCSHFKECGGCQWQFIEYKEQYNFKVDSIRRKIAHLKLNPDIVKASGPAPSEYHYRQRARFIKKDSQIGFLKRGSHDIVDISDCPVLEKTLQKKFTSARSDWTKDGRYDLDLSNNQYFLNQEAPFSQSNREQNNLLKKLVAEVLIDAKPELSCELFCGDGNFTQVLLQLSKSNIFAFDSSSEAIKKLRKSSFFEPTRIKASAEDIYKKNWRPLETRFDFLLLDPPRSGMKSVGVLVSSWEKLKNIVYISCDPATFFRDFTTLQLQGFGIKSLWVVDMNPQTAQIELVVQLTKN